MSEEDMGKGVLMASGEILMDLVRSHCENNGLTQENRDLWQAFTQRSEMILLEF